MSSRYYPIYQKGNPQLRVFLPNFWMKLIKPKEKQPPNVVQFVVPIAMTDYDVRNYLEKIYKIEIANIRSKLEDGKIKEAFKNGYLVKEEDFRRVYVFLPRGQTFEFPEIHQSEKKTKQIKEETEELKSRESGFNKYLRSSRGRQGVPTWFSI